MKENIDRLYLNIVAILSSIIAAGVHSYLTLHHYELLYGRSEGASICNIGEKWSCDIVNTSPFSEVFGVPIALFGAIAAIVLTLLLIWQRALRFQLPPLNRLLQILAVFIFIVSIIMGAISYFVLQAFCLFCSITYLLSLITAIAVWKQTSQLATPSNTIGWLFKRGSGSGFSYLLWLLAVPIFAIIGSKMFESHFAQGMDLFVAESIGQWKMNPQQNFDATQGLKKKSGDHYKMTIVEFADFNCPHCRHAAPSLHAFAGARSDVQLIFMNFPLDGRCNNAIPRPGRSCELAKSVYCAQKLGDQGWAAHDWLFQNQGHATTEALSSNLHADASAFTACIESQEAHNTILQEANAGERAQIRGTPSIFVNGRMLPGGQMIPVLEAVYKTL